MLIETYGVIVKKSEFLSYSAKNSIQNGVICRDFGSQNYSYKKTNTIFGISTKNCMKKYIQFSKYM
jgi:hypothetical protein